MAWVPTDHLLGEDAVLESEGGIMLLDPLAPSGQGAQLGGLVPRDDVTETRQAAVAGAQPGREAPDTLLDGWLQSTWEVAKLSLLILTLISMLWMARDHSCKFGVFLTPFSQLLLHLSDHYYYLQLNPGGWLSTTIYAYVIPRWYQYHQYM